MTCRPASRAQWRALVFLLAGGGRVFIKARTYRALQDRGWVFDAGSPAQPVITDVGKSEIRYGVERLEMGMEL